MTDEFVREMQEDLRNEQLRRLWEKYGKKLAALAAVALLAAIGHTVWKHQSETKAAENTFALSRAITDANLGKRKEAEAAFAELAKNTKGGVRALALLKQAEVRAQSGNAGGAYEAYLQAANDASLDVGLRDYAAIQAGILALDATQKLGDGTLDFLNNATAGDRPYQRVARELQGLHQLKQGKQDEAVKQLSALADEEETSPVQRDRIDEVLSVLSIKK